MLLAMVCLILAGCDKGKVTAYLDISTETGDGEFAFDIYIRSDDDTNTQLANGIDGVVKSIQAYGEEKGVEFALSTRKETVQKWDDNEEDELAEDHEADVINIKFTFDSLENLNAKMVTLSNNGEIASTKGFGEFIPNPDGTTTFSYRNKAIEEVVLAIETYVHDDTNAYSGSEAADGLADTDYFMVTVDDNFQEMNLQAYAAFPNRHFEVAGTYINSSKIVTSTPEPTSDAGNESENAAETVSNPAKSTDEENSFPQVILVVIIMAVVCITVVFIVILQKKKHSTK